MEQDLVQRSRFCIIILMLGQRGTSTLIDLGLITSINKTRLLGSIAWVGRQVTAVAITAVCR